MTFIRTLPPACKRSTGVWMAQIYSKSTGISNKEGFKYKIVQIFNWIIFGSHSVFEDALKTDFE
jgi:hypothetical protein